MNCHVCRLLESRSKYSDLEREHKELRNNKEKEINSLQNKWETSQETTAAVTNKYILYICTFSEWHGMYNSCYLIPELK